MSSEILSTLLLEYDQKKRKAEMDLETRTQLMEIKNKMFKSSSTYSFEDF